MKNKEVTSYRKETTTVIGIGFKSFTICSTIALNRPLPSTMNKQTSAMVKSNGPTVVIPIRILEGMGGRERKTTWSGPPYCLPPPTHTPPTQDPGSSNLTFLITTPNSVPQAPLTGLNCRGRYHVRCHSNSPFETRSLQNKPLVLVLCVPPNFPPAREEEEEPEGEVKTQGF